MLQKELGKKKCKEKGEGGKKKKKKKEKENPALAGVEEASR